MNERQNQPTGANSLLKDMLEKFVAFLRVEIDRRKSERQ